MPKGHQIHVLLAFAKRTGKRNELGLIVAPKVFFFFRHSDIGASKTERPRWGRATSKMLERYPLWHTTRQAQLAPSLARRPSVAKCQNAISLMGDGKSSTMGPTQTRCCANADALVLRWLVSCCCCSNGRANRLFAMWRIRGGRIGLEMNLLKIESLWTSVCAIGGGVSATVTLSPILAVSTAASHLAVR